MPDQPDRTEYVLLWDAADDLARENGYSAERNWLDLMMAYWRGALPRLVQLYRHDTEPPRIAFIAHERNTLAGSLLGHGALERGEASIADFTHWHFSDYLRADGAFCERLKRDPAGRLGLAIPRQDFEKGRQVSLMPASAPSETPPPRRRGPLSQEGRIDPKRQEPLGRRATVSLRRGNTRPRHCRKRGRA